MIVTCPSCNAKYRVRDDAVPQGGAQLKCPECDTMFLAHRPAHSDQELTDAIDRLTKQNHEAEGRIRDLEKRVRDVTSESERQRSEFRRLNEEAGRALAARDKEVAELRAEVARAREERGQSSRKDEQLRSYEAKVHELALELQGARDEADRLRLNAASRTELHELKEALVQAQKITGRLTAELDSNRGTIAHLQDELQRIRQAGGSTAALEAQVASLREQLAKAGAAAGQNGASPQLLSLIGAVDPMLWGLDQAVRYLEPFAPTEPALAAHVRHLQLLAGMLKRLVESSGRSGT